MTVPATRRRLRWAFPAAGLLVLATAGLGTAVATADDDAPAAASAGAPYGYGPSSLTDCFDDRGVPYRQEDTAEGRSMTPLGQNDPDTAAATQACSDVTARPASADLTAYGNAVSGVIVDCLRDLGYTIDAGNDEWTDGGGRRVTSWSTVPRDVAATQGYQDDTAACTAYAESQVPSPAPAS